MDKNSYVFYQTTYETLMCLPKSKQLKFRIMLDEYGLFGKEPENFAKDESVIWNDIKLSLKDKGRK